MGDESKITNGELKLSNRAPIYAYTVYISTGPVFTTGKKIICVIISANTFG